MGKLEGGGGEAGINEGEAGDFWSEVCRRTEGIV